MLSWNKSDKIKRSFYTSVLYTSRISPFKVNSLGSPFGLKLSNHLINLVQNSRSYYVVLRSKNFFFWRFSSISYLFSQVTCQVCCLLKSVFEAAPVSTMPAVLAGHTLLHRLLPSIHTEDTRVFPSPHLQGDPTTWLGRGVIGPLPHPIDLMTPLPCPTPPCHSLRGGRQQQRRRPRRQLIRWPLLQLLWWPDNTMLPQLPTWRQPGSSNSSIRRLLKWPQPQDRHHSHIHQQVIPTLLHFTTTIQVASPFGLFHFEAFLTLTLLFTFHSFFFPVLTRIFLFWKLVRVKEFITKTSQHFLILIMT